MTKCSWKWFSWLGVGVLLVLTSIPVAPVVNVSHFDKVEHLTAFFGLTMVFRFAYPNHTWPVYLGCIGLGLAIEAIQSLIPWRSAELLDLVADTAGVVLCMVLIELTPIKKQLRR